MKSIAVRIATGAFALAMSVPAFANGQGSPVEPAPQEAPVPLEPAGPAPAETVQTTSSGTNWWLVGLGAAAVVGLVVVLADDDDDDTNS